jgi:hypothetical protein
MARFLPVASALLAAFALAGCSSESNPPAASATPSPSASASPVPEATETPQATSRPESIEGTVVRFSAGGTSVDVTLGADHAATRDLLSMLPLTLRLEDLRRKEKISYLPRELDTEGAPGSDPEDGDLSYFKPWGNLGFSYDARGIDYSDDTVNLGSYRASEQQLRRLENVDVTVDVVD